MAIYCNTHIIDLLITVFLSPFFTYLLMLGPEISRQGFVAGVKLIQAVCSQQIDYNIHSL